MESRSLDIFSKRNQQDLLVVVVLNGTRSVFDESVMTLGFGSGETAAGRERGQRWSGPEELEVPYDPEQPSRPLNRQVRELRGDSG